ncbi:hypothetical protein GQ600_12802 [Phytophthora cactorum]|nr:hypothetical protein GQ600_12802 [Phytophthora cactorum]
MPPPAGNETENGDQVPVPGSDGSPPDKPRPNDDHAEKEPTSAEVLASALRQAVQDAASSKPWLDLVQQLFEQVYPRSLKKKEMLSFAAQKPPRPSKQDQERLVDMSHHVVKLREQYWHEWRWLVEDACRWMYYSRQSLVNVLVKGLSRFSKQAAEAASPILTKWAQKVNGDEATTHNASPSM